MKKKAAQTLWMRLLDNRVKAEGRNHLARESPHFPKVKTVFQSTEQSLFSIEYICLMNHAQLEQECMLKPII